MVRGQVATIPSGTGVLLTTLSREEKASMAILNPNDGVIYLKMNSPASIAPTNWDWKLPSQSYGQYPGPWQSLGLYYQDQSGSNAAGQVNLYESDAELAIPSIVAIGRAAQVAGTQVDITQGTIPQNPPASTSRLWIDTSGHLHLLDSTGSDKTVVDSNNISSYVTPLIAGTALGGDLYGTIPNGHVWAHTNPVQLDRTVNVQWGSNANMDRIVIWSDTNMYIDVTGSCQIRPGGNTVLTVSSVGVTVTGALQVSGNTNFSGWIAPTGLSGSQAGDIVASRSGGTTGVVYLGSSLGRYLFYDGGTYQLPSAPLNVGGNITASGNVSVNGNTVQFADGGSYFTASSSYMYLRANNGLIVQNLSGSYGPPINCGPINSQLGQFSIDLGNGGYGYCFRDTNVMMRRPVSANYLEIRSYDRRIDLMDNSGTVSVYSVQGSSNQVDHYGYNGSTNHRFFHFDTSWMGTQAANFQVQSSVRHAELYKKPIEPISNAVQIVLDLDPVYYYHVIMKEDDTPLDEELSGYPTYGFSPTQVASVIPEVVNGDFIDYNRLIPILWQAVKELVQRAEPKVVNTP